MMEHLAQMGTEQNEGPFKTNWQPWTWYKYPPENMTWNSGNMRLVSSNTSSDNQCWKFGKRWGGRAIEDLTDRCGVRFHLLLSEDQIVESLRS